MSENRLIKEIKKLRVNAVYGKKTHFNAAHRKRRKHHWFSLPTILINIVTGTTLFALTTDALKDKLWIPASAAFLSAIISGISEYFKFGKAAAQHDLVGTRYLHVIRKCDHTKAKFEEGIIDLKMLSIALDELAIELDEINASAANLQPNNDDYEKSRAGVKDGEEIYTEQELKA